MANFYKLRKVFDSKEEEARFLVHQPHISEGYFFDCDLGNLYYYEKGRFHKVKIIIRKHKKC